MKEVTITGYCDGEDHGDGRRASTIEREVAVDGSKPVILDMCEDCDAVFQKVLLLMEKGAPAKALTGRKKGSSGRPGNNAAPTTIPMEGPHICPDCQFESKSRQALGQHLSARHNKGFKDFLVA